jgi:hypothetical protein
MDEHSAGVSLVLSKANEPVAFGGLFPRRNHTPVLIILCEEAQWCMRNRFRANITNLFQVDLFRML